MAQGYFLNEDDRNDLAELLAWYRAQEGRSVSKSPSADREGLRAAKQGPSRYIVRTPSGGIPALNKAAGEVYGTGTAGTGTGTGAPADDEPGSAECQVYRILLNVAGEKRFVPIGKTITVHNFNNVDIAGGVWALAVREEFGTWCVPTIGFEFTEC